MADDSTPSTSGHQSLTKSRSGLGSRLGISPPAVKKRKAAQNKKYKIGKHQISFGTVFEDWLRYKQQSGLKTNDDALRHLLYTHSPAEYPCLPSCLACSKTGSSSKAVERHSSEHDIPDVMTSTPIRGHNSGRQLFECQSPVSPIEKQMEILDESSEESTNSDCDAEFSQHETPDAVEDDQRQPCLELDVSTIEDEVLDFIDPGTHDGDETEAPDDSDFSFMEVQRITEERKCLAFSSSLVELLKKVHGSSCRRRRCTEPLIYSAKTIGTALFVSWVCTAGHKCGSWTSQPRFRGMLAGNLQLAAALLLSGNSFLKVSLMFKFANIAMFSKDTFYRVQGKYAAPAIKEYWEDMQREKLSQCQEKISLAGDGRNDSPGHSAQYCTYTLADTCTKEIVHLEVVDSREVAGKSVNMEVLGFERAIGKLLDQVGIQEVTTDAHSSISAKLRNCDKYKKIVHTWDMWHGGKSVYKKAIALSSQKGLSKILPWADAIRSHLWYAAKKCNGDTDLLKAIWISYLHHVVNEHEWIVTDGLTSGTCNHGELSEDERKRPWLEKDSPEHQALRKLVFDDYIMKNIHYYRNFRHTGFVESFHNHLLMYAPKRHAYGIIGYKTRNILAAIDCNKHRDRPQQVGPNGKPTYEKKYSKRSKKWTAQPKLAPKAYAYIPDLMENVFMKRITTFGHLSQHVSMSADDPRRIAKTIAANPAPSIEKLVEERMERMQKN